MLRDALTRRATVASTTRMSRLLLLAPAALAAGFADALRDRLEAAPHRNPITSGEPIAVEAPPPPQARSSACDVDVPRDKAAIRAGEAEICFQREWTRVTALTARDPDPQRFESWFASDQGETAHFQPEGEVVYLTECRGDAGSVKVFRETWKGCTPNAGVLTEHTTVLRLVTRPAGLGKGLGIKQTLWEVRLTNP